MKKLFLLSVVIIIAIVTVTSCKSTQVIANKTGVQLWAENCTRCHYAPTAIDFNDHEWDIIGMHMQVHAQLTKIEKNKIIEYLKDSN